MKPFLLIATRAEDKAADDEFDQILRFGRLTASDVRRVRLEQAPMPALDLDDYSGIIVGGSPFTGSEPEETKSPTQVRVEAEIATLLDEVVDRDFPFLGACYGVGTLGRHQGAVIDFTYGEPVGGTIIDVTDAGRDDPLLTGITERFSAFVGHKEAVRSLPDHAVLLAESAACPVQMFRIRENLYGTQFHPELDAEGIATRIRIYRNAGYFEPEEADTLVEAAYQWDVSDANRIIANFTARYARSESPSSLRRAPGSE